MKIAVIGKGGSGKTTTAAVVARTFARSGRVTIALDCDTNPNLGISLGIDEDRTEHLVAVRDAVDSADANHPTTAADVIDAFGLDGPDGVRLAVVNAIENPKPGCPCCGISPEGLLAELSATDRTVIADFEAGIGTVMRIGDHRLDVFLVVVEPTGTSIDVGRRAADLVEERQLGRLVIIANRVRDSADAARVQAAFLGTEVVLVPDEPAIATAERHGCAPLDAAPDAPGVRALVNFSQALLT